MEGGGSSSQAGNNLQYCPKEFLKEALRFRGQIQKAINKTE